MAPIKDDVEDHHYKKGDVEGWNGSYGMKVSFESDKHPGGENENPRHATQGDSRWSYN